MFLSLLHVITCITVHERWVFGFSTGHSGTKFLSNKNNFEINESKYTNLCFSFEGNHFFKKKHPSVKSWLKTKPTNQTALKVAKKLLAWYRLTCQSVCTEDICTTIYVDLGHHIILGLYNDIFSILGSNATVIRLKRNRTQTALSFFFSNRIPCQENGGDFILCPKWHSTKLKSYVQGFWKKWQQLNLYQRCLWFYDEVELQWDLLIAQNPSFQYEEYSWSNERDMIEIHKKVAKLINNQNFENKKIMTSKIQSNSKHNKHAQFVQNQSLFEQVAKWEHNYKKVLGI